MVNWGFSPPTQTPTKHFHRIHDSDTIDPMSKKRRINTMRWTDRWLPTRRAVGLGGLLAVIGLAWVVMTWPNPIQNPDPATILRMDDASFVYSPGWRVDELGADPTEPADAWQQPAGVVSFDYTGQDLALAVAEGDYWAYLLVTVDGQPANQLPVLPDVADSLGENAGYRPLSAPEVQSADGPAVRWLTVHRAAQNGLHSVRVEVWRGWGQTPLRGVAVDGLPAPKLPVWPGVILLLTAGWMGVGLLGRAKVLATGPGVLAPLARLQTRLLAGKLGQSPWQAAALTLALVGAGMGATGVWLDLWPATVAGLGLLGLAGLVRPAVWLAGLLFGLPFYLLPLPLLPGRSLNLVEVGVYGGLAVLAGHLLLRPDAPRRLLSPAARRGGLLLGLLVSVALVATFAYPVSGGYFTLALREWRTVFLAAGLFGLLLGVIMTISARPEVDRTLLILAWVAGGAAVGLVGLVNYVNGNMIVPAEGVDRLRSVYGSPNNLALYLERTLLMSGALALFDKRSRWLWMGLTAVQGVALLLTFSKGALLLGMPAGVAVLALGGWWMKRRRGESGRLLIWLGLAVVVAVAALTPFLGTERFQRLLDMSQGSTGFFRVQLWRSAWQMILDHPLWGVGPDNFLYAFRSGYILPTAWQEPNLNHPHNVLLDLWTRLGLPGLLVAGVWLGATVRSLVGQVRHSHDQQFILALGMLAAVAAALAHGLIDVSYALPDLMVVWVLFSMHVGEGARNNKSG